MSVNLNEFGMAAGFIGELTARGNYKPLSTCQINFLVGKGCWIINMELRQAPLGPILNEATGDCNVNPGTGVADLNKVQAYMDQYPWGRFSVDVGGPNSYAEYVYIGTNDIISWRNAYIALWGTVNRPAYYKTTLVPPGWVNPGIAWP